MRMIDNIYAKEVSIEVPCFVGNINEVIEQGFVGEEKTSVWLNCKTSDKINWINELNYKMEVVKI
jgi:hypothetical protein